MSRVSAFGRRRERPGPCGVGSERAYGPVRLSQTDAIAGIESGKWKFYVARPREDSVWAIVTTSRFGDNYLKTQADGDEPNNLLSPPECPP